MARFGEFCACRANFVPLWQSTTRAGRTLYRIQGGCGVSRHNRTPSATGVEGAGVSGGPVCGAHGRWRAWPGFETTHRATHQQPSATGVEGAGGTGGHGRTGGGSGARLRCPWAAVGPGCGARGRWRGPAAVPVGGGRARAGLEIDHSEPQARVWRSRGRAAAHRHTQRQGPTTERPEHGL